MLVGSGICLLAVPIAMRSAQPATWVLLLVATAGFSLVGAAVRFAMVVRLAPSTLERLAGVSTDPLTGLLNRRGFTDRVDQWLSDGQQVTLLAVDIAEFRRINGEAGHKTGDEVLRHVAAQLTSSVGRDDVVARIYGDDFAVAFAGPAAGRADELVLDLRNTIGQRFVFGNHRLHLMVNIAVTTSHPVVDGGPLTTDRMLHCADQALADAQSRSGGMAVHDPGSCGQRASAGLLTWVDELHGALGADDQLLVHVQPQRRVGVGGTAGEVTGCEALLRWSHPTRGLLGPAEALRAAEHGHLVGELTGRVLDLALTAVAGWWSEFRIPVAVNLGAVDLDDDLLPLRLRRALERYGMPASAITVEIVEDTLMINPERARAVLNDLRSVGLRIAVDDFGTGYSSLSYLHRLPVDEVKFDRSLTAGVSEDDAAATIIRHGVELVHDLGMLAVAEGIETRSDLELLWRLGCDTVQGFVVGRPMPVADWSDLLASSGASCDQDARTTAG